MKKELCALILCAVVAQAGFIKEGMEAKESGDHKKLVEVYDKACNEGKGGEDEAQRLFPDGGRTSAPMLTFEAASARCRYILTGEARDGGAVLP
jgi:hypothetical protein